MKIVVTGAAGFIGSSFCRYVLDKTNYSLVGFDSLTYAANQLSIQDLLGKRFQLVVGDLNDTSLLTDTLSKADVVVNFAAETHNDISIEFPERFVDSNIRGTFSLLEAVRDTGIRLHHVSTDEVYGDLPLLGNEQFTESTPYNPSSPYSASKASSDMLVRSWVRTYKVAATISNCSNNYGPRQHVEKFIPRQITEVLDGRPPKLYGSGANVRDWIHVDDHCQAVLRVVELGRLGETYLIGSRNQRSNIDVVRTILRVMGKGEDLIEFVEDRPGHDLRYAIDPTKFEREIGWERSTREFESSLEETISWYAMNPSWWRAQKNETEGLTGDQIEAK